MVPKTAATKWSMLYSSITYNDHRDVDEQGDGVGVFSVNTDALMPAATVTLWLSSERRESMIAVTHTGYVNTQMSRKIN